MADNINNYNFLCVIAQAVLRRKILLAAIILNIKERKYNKKEYWISDFLKQRNIYGTFYVTIPALLRDNDLFRNYCRMS